MTVLREMARDPETAKYVREAVSAIGSDELVELVVPTPAEWSSTDYQLFYIDERVRLAEFRRRMAAAVDEWTQAHGVGPFGRGPDEMVRQRIEESTRQELLGEIREWARRSGIRS